MANSEVRGETQGSQLEASESKSETPLDTLQDTKTNIQQKSSIWTERGDACSLAQINRRNHINECTNICASSNQTSSNQDENPKQTLSHKPLCLDIRPDIFTDCIAAGTKVKHEHCLVEEVAKHFCAMDFTSKTTLEGKGELTPVELDKYIYKHEDLDIAKTNLRNELPNVNCDKGGFVLDVTLCSKPSLHVDKSLCSAEKNMSANVLKSAMVIPNENKSLQVENKSKSSADEALASEKEMETIDTVSQGDSLRENTIPGGIHLKLVEFGQRESKAGEIVKTKYSSSVKEVNLAFRDKTPKHNSVEMITMAKQVPTKTLQISKHTLVKMEDASFDVPHSANSSLNSLSRKGRKMYKVNYSNFGSERIKPSSKSLQYLPISRRKDMLVSSSACFLHYKNAPVFPSLDNSHLRQISSKVQGGIFNDRSTSKEKSHSHDSSNINILDELPIQQFPRLNSTGDFLALKYSDMFQEINPIDKGPGIYEMFSSPLYCAKRKSTTLGAVHQIVHSVPRRRRPTFKVTKSNQATEKNNAVHKKNKLNSKQKKINRNMKRKNKNTEESRCLFMSDKNQANVGLISDQYWHARTFRNEVSFHNSDGQEISDSGFLSNGSVASYPLPGYEVHLEGQYLSIIREDSIEQAAVKPVLSEGHDNPFNKSSAVTVGGNLCDYATDYPLSSTIPKINNIQNCNTDLFELGLHMNKKNKADVKSTKIKDSVGTNIAQEPTAALSYGNNWDIVVNEAETTVLCTEGQKNISSYETKAASHPNFKQISFPVQSLINTWTVDQMNPAFLFKYDREDSLTDGLLGCLTPALWSEEKNTYESTTQMATHVQQMEHSGNKDNESVKPSLSAEYTVTKLLKTSSRPNSSLCNSMKSECSSSGEDVIIWTKGNIMGKGAYGTVYCGLTSQGQLIAVKQIGLDSTNQTAAEKEYQKLEEEIELLKALKHVNIVRFLGTNLEANVVSIFMEFVPGGSIASIISCFGPLSEPVFCGYTKQILKGVDYLHDNNVIHRDIKGNNVMLMPNGVIKLIDFGCAKYMACVNMNDTQTEMLKSMHGTPYWMAPEVINQTGHGRKSDIWSIGCTVFEMASGKPPLGHMDKMAAMFYIGAHRGPMPTLHDQFSENAQDFVQICLTRDQHIRPSAKQLLQHAFIIKRQRRTAIPGK
ncbi:mitogen-activated protein kinase kinase kinase 19 [Hemitrygon akajei]|uniref:mitogen-activated protein kinase kinase kinase 19 n=1 Tax=Hemitrygon akajei TaxID=2704970 RepID=UPI003BF9AF01